VNLLALALFSPSPLALEAAFASKEERGSPVNGTVRYARTPLGS
jgi:hypothetical protein